jgi:tyrosine-specific transport protein
MFLAYLFTTATGLLLLEATLWFDKRVNLLSIAQFALGKGGRLLVGALFLFLFYSLFVAYIDGGGELISRFLGVPREVGILACASFVGAVLYAGTRVLDRLNRGLMIGLGLSYCALIAFGLPHVKVDNLQLVDIKASLATIPILLVCFGYQNLVPSLTYYLKKNVAALRFAILVGNFIPFLIYLLWNYVILGMIPDGRAFDASQSEMVAGLLQGASQAPQVLFFVQSFSFFALLTSFLPNALTFVDFLKDGIKRSCHDFFIYALVLLPPTIFTLFYPHLFLKALGFAGGFVDVVLFGVLPVLIVAIGRYVKKIRGPYTLPGGKAMLLLIFLLSLGFLLLRIVEKI